MEWLEISAKSVDEALTEAMLKFETTRDKLDYEIIEKETSGFLGMFGKLAKIKVKVKNTAEDIAKDFLEKVLKAMNIISIVNTEYNEEEKMLDIYLEGENMGVVIGKRGQTLDSLQYIISLVVNKEKDEYIKIKLDTENYRERRKETLENLARNIASKVKRTRRSVTLEPMNPYERRIIHSVLQGDKAIQTYSEGSEPYRKVVIDLKKGSRDNRSNKNNNKYNKNYSTDYKKDYLAYKESKENNKNK